ncbi:hypothetical protein FHW77_005313 [Agrobacterium sp. RC10-4-1]|nr:hypothetical protein [Agrobacterium sp. RC10-4-1]
MRLSQSERNPPLDLFRSLIGIILFASAIEVPILSLTICHIGIARWLATGN